MSTRKRTRTIRVLVALTPDEHRRARAEAKRRKDAGLAGATVCAVLRGSLDWVGTP